MRVTWECSRSEPVGITEKEISGETDLFFGFIPKHDSHRAKMTMTLKQNYMP